MASVGAHIRRLRTAKALTQEQPAETLFVPRQAVSAWETGKGLPDVETPERIAAALGTEVTEVICGVPQTPDLKWQRRKWMLSCGISAVISAFILIILSKTRDTTHGAMGLPINFSSHRLEKKRPAHPPVFLFLFMKKRTIRIPQRACSGSFQSMTNRSLGVQSNSWHMVSSVS